MPQGASCAKHALRGHPVAHGESMRHLPLSRHSLVAAEPALQALHLTAPATREQALQVGGQAAHFPAVSTYQPALHARHALEANLQLVHAAPPISVHEMH